MLPGAKHVMKHLNECWDPFAKYHEWVLPDGHTAFVRTMTEQDAQYEYNGTKINYKYYINEGNTTSYRSLVPNIIHSIDGYIVRQMILRADFEMVHVHDCFLFHPIRFEQVKELYRDILAELVTNYGLSDIIRQFKPTHSSVVNDPILTDKIHTSNYALS